MRSTSWELDRKKVLEENFLTRVKTKEFPVAASTIALKDLNVVADKWVEIFESQIISRLLDCAARDLKEKNASFYTIGSSGHEGNGVIGDYFTLQDIAFLHYRSGAFMAQRSKKDPQSNFARDCLLSLMASAQDPIAAGRHKVWGSSKLNVPPQTSTIASHLPKAVGYAYGKVLQRNSNAHHGTVDVVSSSFGDASFNHSTAQGAFNAAQYLAFNKIPLPLIFICEDNGIGISVPTPENWLESNVSARTHLQYIGCDGLNMADVYLACQKAEHFARRQQQPVFFHMKTVRLMGHAGSDIESVYRHAEEIIENENNDPLLHSARLLHEAGILSQRDIINKYQQIKDHVYAEAEKLIPQRGLDSAHSIEQSLISSAPYRQQPPPQAEAKRKQIFATAYKNLQQKRTLAQQINFALVDLMLQYSEIIVYGEDVGKKGGVYHVTADLQKRFGQARVIDSLLDETTLLGMAIGMGMQNLLPIPEIQFLAYTHNAVDQLRGEAASLSFFSNAQFQNPMVVRIPGLAYQKGFGGHFHNDNAVAFLREIPGLIVACPSNGTDAAKMLRACVELAYCWGRVVVFLEPIALYSVKDLCSAGDNLWLDYYPPVTEKIGVGEVGVYGQGKDLLIISFGNGYYLSRQAESELRLAHGLFCKLIDVRWLAPLPIEALCGHARHYQKVLIVDECRKTGSLSEEIYTGLCEGCSKDTTIKRITGRDCFITLGESWKYLLPSKKDIVNAALEF